MSIMEKKTICWVTCKDTWQYTGLQVSTYPTVDHHHTQSSWNPKKRSHTENHKLSDKSMFYNPNNNNTQQPPPPENAHQNQSSPTFFQPYDPSQAQQRTMTPPSTSTQNYGPPPQTSSYMSPNPPPQSSSFSVPPPAFGMPQYNNGVNNSTSSYNPQFGNNFTQQPPQADTMARPPPPQTTNNPQQFGNPQMAASTVTTTPPPPQLQAYSETPGYPLQQSTTTSISGSANYYQQQQQPQGPSFSPVTSSTSYLTAPPVVRTNTNPIQQLQGISTNTSETGFVQASQVGGTAYKPFPLPEADGLKKQQSSKIDPNQIPSPAKKKFPEFYLKQQYQSNECQHKPPPSSVSRYSVIDAGNCNPRHIRPTLISLPQSSDILSNSSLPMGAVIHPLADLDPEDEPNYTPLVNLGEYGPIRCTRCRAYINSFVNFVNGGKNFVCNFCDFTNEVPKWYMCNLDGMGKRRDIDERPELKYGSVEFAASKEFIFKPPKPLTYIFVIDTSTNAVTQGIVDSIIETIKTIASEMAETHAENKVAFITFSKTIQFYNVNGGHPQMMVVGDINEVFVPISHDSLMTFKDLAEKEDFLDKIIQLAHNNQENENAIGSALSAAQELLSETGGRIMVFSSQYPNIGIGKFKPREDYKMYGTEKERALFQPLIGFWRNYADQVAKKQICIDTYFFPTSFVESSTLGHISNTTNGHIYVYPNFNQNRDEPRLFNDIKRNVTRSAGYDAVLKVRCSAGLSVKKYLGHYVSNTTDEIDLPGIDADTSFGVELKYDSSLNEKNYSYIQSALLYTNRDGQRLIRVQTSRLGVATSISQVFKFADLDSILSLFTRQSILQLEKNRDNLNTVREMLTSRCVHILSAYRKYCSSGSSQGQLILPESLKLLPIYFLGLMKSPALRQGTDILIDERIGAFNSLMKMDPMSVMLYCYPRMFALHQLSKEDTSESYPDNEIPGYVFPPLVSLSASKIDSNGVYLLDDGVCTYLWVGKEASDEVIYSIFQAESADAINPDTVPNPDTETFIGKRTHAILEALQYPRIRNASIRVFREKDSTESLFFSRLVEDRIGGSMSYSDYLCHLHKEIQSRVY